MLRDDIDHSIEILKDLYEDYFRMGAACELISERNPNCEIGNYMKEELIKNEFNSITFCNELKPAYNMGFDSPDTTEVYLPFVINPAAKEMLDWAKKNDMSVRGHVLVWHAQCSNRAFSINYQPITIPMDPAILEARPMMKFFAKLDPVCFTDRETMRKRLKSYIFSLTEYMYKNGYARIIYAWDVVNEAIEVGDTPLGLRNSYWYQIIGDDFIYWAFRYARDAVEEYSRKYASEYEIDANDEYALKEIQPKLFYNDYNEWIPEKRDAIIAALERSTQEHGSIISEGLIDGIGMQGHLSDNNNISEYIDALKKYAKLVDEVHITELDVKCTCTNVNAEYYQAVFYKEFFKALVEAKKEGANLTSVTLWGLTDDNSWIRGACPLIFHGDLSKKLAFDGIVYALTGESLGEPEVIECNLSDRSHDFETLEDSESSLTLQAAGFKARGFGELLIQDSVVYRGKAALALRHRMGDWSGINYDASDFVGQTIAISAWVKSEAASISLNGDINGVWPKLATVDTTSGEWMQLAATYKIPNHLHSFVLFFDAKEANEGVFHDIYVDDVQIHLIGLEESFEEESNIASIRGAGHLPICYVVDTESRDGKGHSYCVTRQEKDATMKFNVSPYIGRHVEVTAYVKTSDHMIKLGLDGAIPQLLAQVEAKEEWNKITTSITIPENLTTAEFYIETDGNADFYVDDISVLIAE